MKLRFALLPVLALAAAACGAGDGGNAAAPADASPHQPAGTAPAPAPAAPPAAPDAPVRSQTIPAAFHGTFDTSAASCARPSDMRLLMSAKEMRFHESAAIVRGVTIESPTSIAVSGDFQGEGQKWSADHRFRLSEDGRTLTMTGEGVNIARVRCVVEPAPGPSTRWETAASGEGAALYLAHTHLGGERALTLFCPSGSGKLLVNVPGFRAIGSEERMTIGAGGTAVALVADTRGDRLRGGVSGTGPVPAELPAILRGNIAVSYGAQTSGPYAPPPAQLAKNFLAGCRG